MEEVPIIEAKQAKYENTGCYFNTAYTHISNVSEDEFFQFKKKIQEAGFSIRQQSEYPLREWGYNVVFEKDDKIIYLLYIIGLHKIFLGISQDEYIPKWTANQVFEKVPKMHAREYKFHAPQDCGAGNYMVELDCTLKEDYIDYLNKLSKYGFKKFAENEEGINKAVYCANYVKDDLSVTVIYIEKFRKTYVSACFNQTFSKHLFYDKQDVLKNNKEAKTQLHVLELRGGGNCFVWKLKNGHFLISDGGLQEDTDILFEYLERETAKGEKPIIEGWFVSHGHVDHCGAFEVIADKPEQYADRVYVEGIYYNEPNELVFSLDIYLKKASSTLIKDAQKVLYSTEGKHPEIYRTHTGQRYYFNDVVVDIVLGQEQLPFDQYCCDVNDSSTWCMFCVEGQKCLFGGDGDGGGMRFLMCAYDKDYLSIDIFTLLHHGWNTRNYFTDYCKFKTVLSTPLAVQGGKLPELRAEENAHLQDTSEEWISWIGGTKVLSFPYEVKTYETRKSIL